MRPAGEIRQVIGSAARELAAERAVDPNFNVAGGTWREFAARAGVNYQVAKQTVKDMCRAGELQRLAAVRVEGSRRPMTLYGPAGPSTSFASIDTVMRGWSRI